VQTRQVAGKTSLRASRKRMGQGNQIRVSNYTRVLGCRGATLLVAVYRDKNEVINLNPFICLRDLRAPKKYRDLSRNFEGSGAQ
jgi:hypothetical protein